MSIEFYRVLHFFGIMLVFLSLGGVTLFVVNEHARGGEGSIKARNQFRVAAAITHGVGLLLVLVAGFGLLAKYKLAMAQNPWVLVKLGIWFVFGGATVLIYRMPTAARVLWFVLPLLGLAAAWLAVAKPF